MQPEFTKIDDNLWQWREWFIAYAYGRFWMLTPAPRECGPFDYFDDARRVAEYMS